MVLENRETKLVMELKLGVITNMETVKCKGKKMELGNRETKQVLEMLL